MFDSVVAAADVADADTTESVLKSEAIENLHNDVIAPAIYCGDTECEKLIAICKDTFELYTEGKRLILKINSKTLSYNLDTLLWDGFAHSFSIECYPNGFDFIFETRGMSSDYYSEIFIFRLKEKGYVLAKYYFSSSNRYEEGLTGYFGNNISIDSFNINTNYFEGKKGITIRDVSGFQEEKEVHHVNYFKLVKKAFLKKQLKLVSLITHPVAINGEYYKYSDNKNEMYEVGCMAYNSGEYYNAEYIFSKLVEWEYDSVSTYLMLANSYWALNEKPKAIELYKTYVKKNHSQNEVEKYVLERISE